LILPCVGLATARGADQPVELKGSWKILLIMPFREGEFVKLDFQPHGEKLEAKVDAPGGGADAPKVTHPDWRRPNLTISPPCNSLTGKVKGTAPQDGLIYGTITVEDESMPVRVVKSSTPDASPLEAQASIRGFMGAREEKDPKAKLKLLAELARKESPSPKWS